MLVPWYKSKTFWTLVIDAATAFFTFFLAGNYFPAAAVEFIKVFWTVVFLPLSAWAIKTWTVEDAAKVATAAVKALLARNGITD